MSLLRKRRSRDRFPDRYYPLSDQLCAFMDSDKAFFKSLKLAQPKRFEFIPLIFTSHTPDTHDRHADEVIGMWYLDKLNFKKNKGALFKQDFVININKQHQEFVSYTVEKFCNGKSVLLIDDFFNNYGSKGQFYHNGNRWEHNYNDVDDLPNEPNLRTLATIFKIIHHP